MHTLKHFVLVLSLTTALYWQKLQLIPVANAATTAVDTTTLEVSPTPAPNSPINLTFSPIALSLETKPNTPVQGVIKIRNNSTSTEQLDVRFSTFVAGESGDNPKLLDPIPNDVSMNWISADSSHITILPGEWKTVNITFNPPKEASVSHYYTVLFPRSTTPQKTGETIVQGIPAVFVLTTIDSPNAKRELQLTDLKVKHPIVEFLPQEFIVSVANHGNVHSHPTGNIFIDSQTQQNVGVLAINPNTNTILPQSNRDFTVRWDEGFPAYNADGSLNWDLTKAHLFRFGKYTAHLLMVYDNGERDVPVEAFVSFWVIPWRMLLALLVVVVLSMLGVRSVIMSAVRRVVSSRKTH